MDRKKTEPRTQTTTTSDLRGSASFPKRKPFQLKTTGSVRWKRKDKDSKLVGKRTRQLRLIAKTTIIYDSYYILVFFMFTSVTAKCHSKYMIFIETKKRKSPLFFSKWIWSNRLAYQQIFIRRGRTYVQRWRIHIRRGRIYIQHRRTKYIQSVLSLNDIRQRNSSASEITYS